MEFSSLFKTPQFSNYFINKMIFQIENQEQRRVISLEETRCFETRYLFDFTNELFYKDLRPFLNKVLYTRIFERYFNNQPILFWNDIIQIKFAKNNIVIQNSSNYKETPITFESRKIYDWRMANYDNSEKFIELEIKKSPVNLKYFNYLDTVELENLFLRNILNTCYQNNIISYNHISSVPRGIDYNNIFYKDSDSDIRLLIQVIAKEKNIQPLTEYFKTLQLDFLIEYLYDLKNDVPYGTPSTKELLKLGLFSY